MNIHKMHTLISYLKRKKSAVLGEKFMEVIKENSYQWWIWFITVFYRDTSAGIFHYIWKKEGITNIQQIYQSVL